MIEIHSHILPGIDDGAANLTVAENMLKDYAKQGVKKIVCTPHFEPVHYSSQEVLQRYLEKRQLQLNILKNLVCQKKYNIELFAGAEVILSADCLNVLERHGKSLKLTMAGTDYLLVELPRFLSGGYKLLDRLLFNLQLSGYIPVLAHPERAMSQEGMFETLLQWVEQDRLLLQINASSIVFDSRIPREKQIRYSRRKEYVQQLLDADLVHFISSDAHNDFSRPPQNLLAWHEIKKMYGQAKADQLLKNNAEKALDNKVI